MKEFISKGINQEVPDPQSDTMSIPTALEWGKSPIVNLLRERTSDNPQVGAFLIELFDFENGNPGWYKEYYKKAIDRYSQGGDEDQN